MAMTVLWLAALAGLVVVVLVAIATWAVWRMTVAHERIEQHVSAIERHLEAQMRSRPGE